MDKKVKKALLEVGQDDLDTPVTLTAFFAGIIGYRKVRSQALGADTVDIDTLIDQELFD